jgi:RNA polymerase sigma factor (sigma-70 family)
MAVSNRETTWYGLDLRWVYADLLAVVGRQIRSLHHAQDILHDALIRYALFSRDRTITHPRAYLRSIVGTVLADHCHEQARYRSFESDEELESLRGSVGMAPSADQMADLQQRLVLVQQILEALPPRCRQVFWMARIEGITQPEIARLLGISLNMVERHIMRALLDLKAARDRLLP